MGFFFSPKTAVAPSRPKPSSGFNFFLTAAGQKHKQKTAAPHPVLIFFLRNQPPSPSLLLIFFPATPSSSLAGLLSINTGDFPLAFSVISRQPAPLSPVTRPHLQQPDRPPVPPSALEAEEKRKPSAHRGATSSSSTIEATASNTAAASLPLCNRRIHHQK